MLETVSLLEGISFQNFWTRLGIAAILTRTLDGVRIKRGRCLGFPAAALMFSICRQHRLLQQGLIGGYIEFDISIIVHAEECTPALPSPKPPRRFPLRCGKLAKSYSPFGSARPLALPPTA